MSSETAIIWAPGVLAIAPALILGWCLVLNTWIYPGRTGRPPWRA